MTMKTALAVLLCAALAPAAAAAPKAKKARAPEKTMIDASFELSVPAGWEARRGEDGLTLIGPRGADGVNSQINARYVRPGDKLHKSADAYLERLTAPPDVAMPGWKTGPVEKTTVAGRAARRVSRDTSEFVPPSSMNTKEVPMKEVHVVVPAEKGFYVLLYYVPAELDAKGKAAFAAVLKSFKPKL
jgi:hypothetical protein